MNTIISIIKFCAKNFYSLFRPLLPSQGAVLLNSYRTHRQKKMLDKYVPGYPNNKDRPTYESGLIKYIEKHVTSSDKVIIIGGGKGITTIAAAKEASCGKVITYEGYEENYREILANTRMYGVLNVTTIQYKAVETTANLYGGGDNVDVDVIPASRLDTCDILVVDAEGSEINIFNNLNIRPRMILVETHGMYDAPSHEVHDLLKDLGYVVQDTTVADSMRKEYCKENDIRVLCATK